MKTVLYDEHIKLAQRWLSMLILMPVEYQGITAEHLAVRNARALMYPIWEKS